MTTEPTTDKTEKPEKGSGFHHRLFPYMTELTQYATDQEKKPTPWVVRDRSTALRNEREGKGRAMVRRWVPTEWEYVNDDSTTT